MNPVPIAFKIVISSPSTKTAKRADQISTVCATIVERANPVSLMPIRLMYRPAKGPKSPTAMKKKIPSHGNATGTKSSE